jgi:hypothetical protein
MVSIQCVLAQIKADVAAVFAEEQLTRICREAGARWRERTLTPVTTIYVFLLQILHGNTAMTDLPRLSGRSFSPSAYCQARQRLPVAALTAHGDELVAGGYFTTAGGQVSTCWARWACLRFQGDLNGDGCVDQADLGILLADWGAGCP